MSLLGSRLNNLFLIFFLFMKGVFMIENTNFINEKLNEFDKAILQMEYAIRNAFAQDILRPM